MLYLGAYESQWTLMPQNPAIKVQVLESLLLDWSGPRFIYRPLSSILSLISFSIWLLLHFLLCLPFAANFVKHHVTLICNFKEDVRDHG
jgi:hypothetical protein